MDLSKLAEPFEAHDIEWRVGQSGQGNKGPWAKVLAYVTARAIMNRLDEVCGPDNWTPQYTHEAGGVMCHLSIRVRETDEGPPGVPGDDWVMKSDGSDASDIEKFKGGISGALKRAGSVWGIGRYLYNLEEGWAECSNTRSDATPNYAKLKEGGKFFWGPPALPPWALPGGSGSPHVAATKKRKGKKKTDAASAKPPRNPDLTYLSDAQLKLVQTLRRELGVSDESYKARIKRDYQVTTTSDLQKHHAHELIERLQTAVKERNEKDAGEVLDNPKPVQSRMDKLRGTALGYCETVKKMGGTYQNGEPIDYKKEGLVCETLEELGDVIDAMSEEAELESVIKRLDALVQTMSF